MLPSGLDTLVGDDEPLARILTQSSHFNTTGVKAAAFLPHRVDRETSVFRHSGTPAEELWRIGVAAAGERPVYGAGIILAKHARREMLEVVADEPPDRHAVLRDWPCNYSDPDFEKARHKEIALGLARDATLVLRAS